LYLTGPDRRRLKIYSWPKEFGGGHRKTIISIQNVEHNITADPDGHRKLRGIFCDWLAFGGPLRKYPAALLEPTFAGNQAVR
jgi:hypothetical protein